MTPSNDEAGLGGRLPLLRRADLSGAQQTLWDRTEASMGRWADEVGFRSKSADGRFIGPFNPNLRSPEIALSLLQFQIDEAKHTSLSERVRQVIILSVGSVWKAPYELYAHAAAAKHAGLSDQCVAALIEGAPSPELAEEEGTAQRLALALTEEHAVDDALYAEARERFGERGLVDFAILAGCYHLVCGLLNLFVVPAPKAR